MYAYVKYFYDYDISKFLKGQTIEGDTGPLFDHRQPQRHKTPLSMVFYLLSFFYSIMFMSKSEGVAAVFYTRGFYVHLTMCLELT
jgi:hypothetical protein